MNQRKETRMTEGRPTVRIGDVVTIRKTMKELQPSEFPRSVNSLLDHGWQIVSVYAMAERDTRLAELAALEASSPQPTLRMITVDLSTGVWLASPEDGITPDEAATAVRSIQPMPDHDPFFDLLIEALGSVEEPVENAFSYDPWEDDSVDESNLDEVIRAAVSRGWDAGKFSLAKTIREIVADRKVANRG